MQSLKIKPIGNPPALQGDGYWVSGFDTILKVIAALGLKLHAEMQMLASAHVQ